MQGIVIDGAAIGLFFLLANVLSRDDGPWGRVIRTTEICVPAAMCVVFYVIATNTDRAGDRAAYFVAAGCFAFAFLYALFRKLMARLPLWLGGVGEGFSVYIYAFLFVFGFASAASAYFQTSLLPQ